MSTASTPDQTSLVGTMPVLPVWLQGFKSLSEPIRAERWAAFRIGLGLILTLDILLTYIPFSQTFLGGSSLGDPAIFASRFTDGSFRWSIFAGESNLFTLQFALALWLLSAVCLCLGVMPRLAAAIALILSISFQNLNYYIHNSGDCVRNIGLFYLMLSPCGAAWSLGNLATRLHSAKHVSHATLISAWPARLILLQLMAIYFVNGLYKFQGESWRDGSLMQQVLINLAWTRLPANYWPMPELLVPAMTWVVLYWELGFPLLVVMPRTWKATLALGVLFHIGTAIMLQIGLFPLYMLTYYLPLLPWEQLADRWQQKKEAPTRDASSLNQLRTL